MCVRVCVCARVWVCLCVRVCVWAYVKEFVCMCSTLQSGWRHTYCTQTHARTHTHTRTHTLTYTHTHIYIVDTHVCSEEQQTRTHRIENCHEVFRFVAVCCSVFALQCSVLQCFVVWCSASQCVTGRSVLRVLRVLQYTLQCFSVCSVFHALQCNLVRICVCVHEFQFVYVCKMQSFRRESPVRKTNLQPRSSCVFGKPNQTHSSNMGSSPGKYSPNGGGVICKSRE